MSNFLKEAAAHAKDVENARKNRAKMEAAAAARFAKAEEAFEAAKAANAKALEEAGQLEAKAWQEMIEKLGVPLDVAAQIAGADPAHVKNLLTSKAKPQPQPQPQPQQ